MATPTTATAPYRRQAVTEYGKTLRCSRTTDTAAQRALAACDQATGGVVQASTETDGKANETNLLCAVD